MICIYCKENKDKNSFLKTEHIIPQSYGKFTNNIVLHNKVCDECNQYFGNNLEIVLGRDTIEGILRFEYGYMNKEDYNEKYLKKRVIIIINEGPFKNAYAEIKFNKEIGKFMVVPTEQIGILKKDNRGYDFFE